jgi:hypothetical protein
MNRVSEVEIGLALTVVAHLAVSLLYLYLSGHLNAG